MEGYDNNMMDQGDTGRDNNQDNFNYEGNEGKFNQDDQLGFGETNAEQNSFHLDKAFENLENNPKYMQKEEEYTKKIEDLINNKAGKYNITSNWPKVTFICNYILLGTILLIGLNDRFDIVGLTMNFVIFFLQLKLFSPKHMYKWAAIMACSIAIDILVFLDILFVS